MDNDTFSGTVILITGASRGLGRALALQLAGGGASLALCARDGARLDAVAAQARAAGAAGVLAVPADVGSARDFARLVAATFDRYERVDVLVNNASSLGPTPLPHLSDAPSEALREVLEVNLVGAFRLTQAVIGAMLLRDRGLVVNITSDAAVEGYPGWGLYGASKAALDDEQELLRIAQEALQNAVKHGRGAAVRVIVRRQRVAVVLTVRDEGPGFDPAALPRTVRSHGMTTMRQRARVLGGELSVRSAPGEGSEVSGRVPLRCRPA